jgi:hypothetical protein
VHLPGGGRDGVRGGQVQAHGAGVALVRDAPRDRLEGDREAQTAGGGGGDDYLIRNFLSIIAEGATTCSDLRAGVLSATMSLAATVSCQTDQFMPIAMPE